MIVNQDTIDSNNKILKYSIFQSPEKSKLFKSIFGHFRFFKNLDLSYFGVSNMKHFRCYLSDLFLEAKIKVQDDHWETEEDFKEEIAPLFNLTKDQFQIDNMPPKYALTDNKKKYDINLTITNKSKDFVFQLPDKNRIPVTISHLTSIKFIMEEFKTHKIYFHQKTIDTLQFKLCGIKVPKDYNFCCIPEGSIVYISSKYNLIPIKYRDYQFFLSENQTIADAATLTSPFFKDCAIFQIHDSEFIKCLLF